MYVLLYIDVNNMLVSCCFSCERRNLCVPAIVDVKSQINKMAHIHFGFLLIQTPIEHIVPSLPCHTYKHGAYLSEGKHLVLHMELN